MTLLRHRIVRSLVGFGIATAALGGGLAGTAAAAPATPQAAAVVTYTETSLNLGQRLTVSNAGTVIAAPPAAGDAGQRWAEPQRTTVVGGVTKFGFALQPSDNTTRCITDMGANLRVELRACNGTPAQVWQWVFGRQVGGLSYMFWINALSGRKLMFDTFTGEGAFPSFTVIASTKNFTAGTAGEACQLWND
ncbi:hypothetical protein [Virgisporangium aurantiacum]|uniref:Ricin B lectin domain-containing protein n=1 Tax=Virgisporangium aurantiacum TaxID=175570 RepID=A0A8J3ZCA8_9ACTN|nr:hypothetical protein [Virgisporangium aurantiacum]GIJ61277.1 hypothetical protein Vau01_087930 [Virgisporangium aurantiacum]